jgi:hypothetical protein
VERLHAVSSVQINIEHGSMDGVNESEKLHLTDDTVKSV